MTLEYRFENRGTVQVRPAGTDKRGPCWYMLVAAVLLLLSLLLWQFLSGYLSSADASGGIHALTLRGKMDEQEKLIARQQDAIRSLEEQLTVAKRDREVEAVANQELRRKLAAAETDLAAQRDKLVLYEQILSPASLEPGLHIQHFGVKGHLVGQDGKKLDGQRAYHYHLVLANIRNGDAPVKGTVDIVVSGKQNGKPASVPHKDITPAGEKSVTDFEVRHYQSLEGNFLFPSGFEPEAVQVKLTLVEGETPPRLAKTYDWASFGIAANGPAPLTVSTSTKEE